MTVEDALNILHKRPEDTIAWEIIALDVYKPLVAYVATLLTTFKVAPGETSQDIVHDVLLAFYEHQSGKGLIFDSRKSLHSYLRRSCRNLLIDRYRHEKRGGKLIDFLEFRFKDAFQGTSHIYRSIFINEIIEVLPSECGTAFRKYVNEDMSLAEIAEVLDVPTATFYRRWRNCIKAAKEIIVRKKDYLNRLYNKQGTGNIDAEL